MPRKRTKGKTRRWSTGHKGQNCVKLFSFRRGNLNLEWYEHSGGSWSRRCRSLGHSDLARAKEEAKDFAAGLRRGPVGIKVGGLVPLGTLLDTYESKVTAHKKPSSKGHERRVFKLATGFYGREFDVTKLDRLAWNNYIIARRTGELVPEGRKKGTPARNRIIQQDLAALQTVFRWACETRDTDGEYILDRNPWAGYKKPKEKSPQRPRISRQLVTKLYELADSDLNLFMKVCDATGHRSKAVRHLHWNDIRWTEGQILWRGDSDKAETKHETPLPEQIRKDLEQAREAQQRAGRTAKQLKSGFIFPGHTDERPATASHFTKLFAKLKEESGHEFQDRAGFHCFRRLFANEMIGENPAVTASLGGWADTQMLLNVYTEAPKEEERAALQRRRAS